MIKLNNISGKCPKYLNKIEKLYKWTKNDEKEKQKLANKFKAEAKLLKKKNQDLKFVINDYVDENFQYCFYITILRNGVKEKVPMSFFNTEEKFILLRRFIILDLRVEVDNQKVKPDINFKKNLLQNWLNVNGHLFDPTTVDAIYKDGSASRDSKYNRNNLNLNKSEDKGEIETIDLTDDLGKSSPRRDKKRRIRKQKAKEFKLQIYNDENIVMNKGKRLDNDNKDKFTFISMKNLNSKLKISKEKFKRKRYQIKYGNMKEQDNCFYYGLKFISRSFPLNIFINDFKYLNIDKQIELANLNLANQNQGKLIKIADINCSLKTVRKRFDGKILVAFNIGYDLHVEGILNHEYNPEMEERILKLEDDVRLIHVWSLEKEDD